MAQRTLHLAMEVTPESEKILLEYGRQTSKWERQAFGYLYNLWTQGHGIQGWKTGPLAPYLREKGRKLSVNKTRLYDLLLTEHPHPPKMKTDGTFRTDKRMEPTEVGVPHTIAGPTFLQASLSDLGTSFENLLDPKLQEPRRDERHMTNRMRRNVALAKSLSRSLELPLDLGVGGRKKEQQKWAKKPRILRRYRRETPMAPQGLPRFPSNVARFMHSQVKWEERDGQLVAFTVPHPLIKKGPRIRVQFPSSKDENYQRKLHLLADHLTKAQVGVDLHQEEGHAGRLRWYARMAVEVPTKPMITEPKNTLGVHVGEAETATTTLVDATGVRGPSVLRSGKRLRHQIDMLANQRRKLRKASRHKGWDVTTAMDRIRGMEARVRKEEAHVISKAIIDEAERRGAQSISMERLSDRFPRLEEANNGPGSDTTLRDRQFNRRVFQWNRGQFQMDLAYKAEGAGLRLAGRNGEGISPRMDSHTCPRCGTVDPDGRDFKHHRFVCPKCGEIDDEVGASMIVAQRGFHYFTSPRKTIQGPKGPSDDPSPITHRAGGGTGIATSGSPRAYPTSATSDRKGTAPSSGRSPDWSENHGSQPEGTAQAVSGDGMYVGRSVRSGTEAGKVRPQRTGKYGNVSQSDKGTPSFMRDGVSERSGGDMSSQTRSRRRETARPRPYMPAEDPLENGSPLTPKEKGCRRND